MDLELAKKWSIPNRRLQIAKGCVSVGILAWALTFVAICLASRLAGAAVGQSARATQPNAEPAPVGAALQGGQASPGGAQTQLPGIGTLTGHVRGPGGVPVPGATVQLTEKQTGERKVTWTDESGNYTLSGVHPGTYKLEVSLVGFRTDVREPISVAPEKPLKVNVALAMALPEQGVPTMARTHPSGSGGPNGLQGVTQGLEELGGRLNGLGAAGEIGEALGGGGEANVRFSEAATNGGAPQGETSSAGAPEAESGPAPDVQASAANSFLLSGTVARASTPGEDRAGLRERFREFRERGESPGAPGFGGGGGGGGEGFGGPGIYMLGGGFGGGRFGGAGGRRRQINRIRGNIMERYSNSALNARSYPLNVPQSRLISSFQEQAGFGAGGPIVIPKIYNGADKTTFFVNYHLQRARNPFENFGTVPTPAERTGDFSGTVIPSGPLAGTVPILYDPKSNPLGPRTPFPGNQIPASKFDSAAVGLLRFIPLPNLPGSVQNFHLQEALPSASDGVMAHIGRQISAKDSIYGFYFFNSSRSNSVSNFPELTRNTSVRSQNLNVGETHTFSPRIVNSFSLNFNRQRTSTLNPFAFQQNIAGALGIQGISQDPRDWGVPLITFTNFGGLNDVIPSLIRNQTTRVLDTMTLNRGKHNFRFGGELRRVQLNSLTDPDARGTFTFSGFTTSDFAQGFPVAGTGFDFADFLLGLPQTTSVRFGTSSNYLRSWVYSGFVQDDWRVNSHWTLNGGLRYEYFQPFVEKYGHLSDLAIGPGFSSVGVVTGQSPGAFPLSLIRDDKNNFSPRLGVAFRPSTQHSLVFRAGYGLFYDGSIYQRLVQPNLTNQPPFAQASTLVTGPRQPLTLEQGFPEISPNVLRNTCAVDPNFRIPYGQTWNFGIEDEIARNVILSVGYVGTKGTKLDLLLSPNRSLSSSQDQLTIRNALQFTYETSGAASIYHGLQVGLRRQFHGGFSMSGNYTFSKSIDDAAGVGGAGRTVAQNAFDLRAERGLSSFDVRHRLMINHIYELPFGERQRYLNRGGTLARVLGNWQLSGTTTLQSGTPFTARVLGNLSNNNGTGANFSERADTTGLPVSLPGFEQSTLRFFNTAAFTLPAPGQLGNAGRNTIPGPRMINFNMSVDRHFTISAEKRVRADFRVEANNIFNTPVFSGLATTVNATDFGRVTGVRTMRTVAISMRLQF